MLTTRRSLCLQLEPKQSDPLCILKSEPLQWIDQTAWLIQKRIAAVYAHILENAEPRLKGQVLTRNYLKVDKRKVLTSLGHKIVVKLGRFHCCRCGAAYGKRQGLGAAAHEPCAGHRLSSTPLNNLSLPKPTTPMSSSSPSSASVQVRVGSKVAHDSHRIGQDVGGHLTWC